MIPSAAGLRARREQLQVQVVALRRELSLATALLESLRASRPEPRGFVWGLFGGAAVIALGFAAVTYFLELWAGQGM